MYTLDSPSVIPDKFGLNYTLMFPNCFELNVYLI